MESDSSRAPLDKLNKDLDLDARQIQDNCIQLLCSQCDTKFSLRCNEHTQEIICLRCCVTMFGILQNKESGPSSTTDNLKISEFIATWRELICDFCQDKKQDAGLWEHRDNILCERCVNSYVVRSNIVEFKEKSTINVNSQAQSREQMSMSPLGSISNSKIIVVESFVKSIEREEVQNVETEQQVQKISVEESCVKSTEGNKVQNVESEQVQKSNVVESCVRSLEGLKINEEQQQNSKRNENVFYETPKDKKRGRSANTPVAEDRRLEKDRTIRENKKENDPRLQKTLYVGNLTETITEDTLIRLFGQFGPVVNIKIKSGYQRAYALIEFASKKVAEEVFNMMNVQTDLSLGTEMRIKWSDKICNDLDLATTSVSSACVDTSLATLYITHVGTDKDNIMTTKKKVCERFSQFGTILGVHVINRNGNLIAFVSFSTREEAEMALMKMHGTLFEKRALVCDWALRNMSRGQKDYENYQETSSHGANGRS